MSDSNSPIDTDSTKSATVLVEIFDPPMCCSTGICGPTIDPELIAIDEVALTLKGEGAQVERYQMAQQPQTFRRYPEVFRMILEQKLAALPITTVNGQIIKSGAYPRIEEIRAAFPPQM